MIFLSNRRAGHAKLENHNKQWVQYNIRQTLASLNLVGVCLI